jgi:hypothetical protein
MVFPQHRTEEGLSKFSYFKQGHSERSEESRIYNTKFCFRYNQLKFQLADNPGLFNLKPKTKNGIIGLDPSLRSG